MSLIRGRIWPEREIRQKKITFGKMPENLSQCQCGCEKWFDTSSGKPVEIKVLTFNELLKMVNAEQRAEYLFQVSNQALSKIDKALGEK